MRRRKGEKIFGVKSFLCGGEENLRGKKGKIFREKFFAGRERKM